MAKDKIDDKIIGYYPVSEHKKTPARKNKIIKITNEIKKMGYGETTEPDYYVAIKRALGIHRKDMVKEAFANIREYMVITADDRGRTLYSPENLIKQFSTI